MGFIYVIKSTKTSKRYIGQTASSIEQRWYEHKQAAQRYIKYADTEPENIRSILNSCIYKAMAKYGIATFSAEQIIEADDAELNKLETKYIEEYGTLVPAGYNMTTGGDHFAHSSQSIEKMTEAKRANIDKHRNPILFGMPPKVSYSKPGSRAGEGIRVANHPLCDDKFFSVKKYGTIDNAKMAALQYIAQVEKWDEIPTELPPCVANIPEKPVETITGRGAKIVGNRRVKRGDPDLPKGMIETSKGFRIQKQHKGIKYFQNFENNDFTREQNKASAINWYDNELPKLIKNSTQNKVQRLNVGGCVDASLQITNAISVLKI